MEESFTVRARGPTWRVLGLPGRVPTRLRGGAVARRRPRLLPAAGPRTEPPVSSPIPAVAKFAATPEPVPPEDPLAWRRGSYAFRIGPDAEPKIPDANSPIVAFAIMMAPAFLSLATTVASLCGTKSLNTADP